MRRKLHAGTTSLIESIYLRDISVTTRNAGQTGYAFGTSGLSLYYQRQGDATWTAVSLITMTMGTWVSGGFIEEDSTHAPGSYSIGIPNAAIAAGVSWVKFHLRNATSLDEIEWTYDLDAVNYQDGTHFGLGALPNATAGATLGLPILSVNAGTQSFTNPVTFTGGVVLNTVTASTTTLGVTTIGQLIVTNTTTHTGAVVLSGSLSIAGVTALATVTLGATTLASATVSGATALQGVVSLGTTTLGQLTITNTTTLTGPVALAGTLSVGGTTTLNTLTVGASTISSASIGGALSLGSLSVAGATIMHTWTVNNTATFSQGIVAVITGSLSGNVGGVAGVNFTDITTQVDKIGTNNGDGPLAVTAQGIINGIATATTRLTFDGSNNLYVNMNAIADHAVVLDTDHNLVVSLSPAGLNNISMTAPTGVATNFRELVVQLWRRFFKKTTKVKSGTAVTIKTFADDGSTILTTQTGTDDGAGNQTLGNAS